MIWENRNCMYYLHNMITKCKRDNPHSDDDNNGDNDDGSEEDGYVLVTTISGHSSTSYMLKMKKQMMIC